METTQKILSEFQEHLNENPADNISVMDYCGQLTRFFAQKHALLHDRISELEKAAMPVKTTLENEVDYKINKNPKAEK